MNIEIIKRTFLPRHPVSVPYAYFVKILLHGYSISLERVLFSIRMWIEFLENELHI